MNSPDAPTIIGFATKSLCKIKVEEKVKIKAIKIKL